MKVRIKKKLKKRYMYKKYNNIKLKYQMIIDLYFQMNKDVISQLYIDQYIYGASAFEVTAEGKIERYNPCGPKSQLRG